MTIEERAREFILSRTRYATEHAVDIYKKDFAEFATIERESAVREFVEKVRRRADRLFAERPGVTYEQASDEVFREMFGKDYAAALSDDQKKG